jgi:hypothetical protein
VTLAVAAARHLSASLSLSHKDEDRTQDSPCKSRDTNVRRRAHEAIAYPHQESEENSPNNDGQQALVSIRHRTPSREAIED